MSQTLTRKEAAERHVLPQGRVINASLFERDIYTDPKTGAQGKARYQIELAFEPKDLTGEGTIEDKIADCLAEAFGEPTADAFLNGGAGVITPILDGDKLAADRAGRGKEGDAYKGKLVVRAHNGFNKDGVAGPGGMWVYGPDTKALGATEQGQIYPGCFGCAAVTLKAWEDSRTKVKSVTFYLVAFQKTADGEKLRTGSEPSGLFKPVGGAPGTPEAGTRRRRPG